MRTGKPTKIKAVLFDVDGVLVDSFTANQMFLGDIVERLGHPRPTMRAYRSAFHLPLRQAVLHLSRAERTEELERLSEVVATVPYRADLLSEPPRAKETLKALRARYALGIITSRSKDGLNKRYFPFSKTRKYFSACVTVEEVTHHKPHPEPLLLAAKRLRVKPEACVYIGDSHTDVEAGRAAGMKTILYGGKKNAAADAHTRFFRNLPKIIARW